MTCTKCGTTIGSDARFCQGCGSPVVEDKAFDSKSVGNGPQSEAGNDASAVLVGVSKLESILAAGTEGICWASTAKTSDFLDRVRAKYKIPLAQIIVGGIDTTLRKVGTECLVFTESEVFWNDIENTIDDKRCMIGSVDYRELVGAEIVLNKKLVQHTVIIRHKGAKWKWMNIFLRVMDGDSATGECIQAALSTAQEIGAVLPPKPEQRASEELGLYADLDVFVGEGDAKLHAGLRRDLDEMILTDVRAVSWSWPAFLWTPIYYAYRKVYKDSAAYFGLFLVAGWLFPPAVLLIAVVGGATFSKRYLQRFMEIRNKIDQEAKDSTERKNALIWKGGTNFLLQLTLTISMLVLAVAYFLFVV